MTSPQKLFFNPLAWLEELEKERLSQPSKQPESMPEDPQIVTRLVDSPAKDVERNRSTDLSPQENSPPETGPTTLQEKVTFSPTTHLTEERESNTPVAAILEITPAISETETLSVVKSEIKPIGIVTEEELLALISETEDDSGPLLEMTKKKQPEEEIATQGNCEEAELPYSSSEVALDSQIPDETDNTAATIVSGFSETTESSETITEEGAAPSSEIIDDEENPSEPDNLEDLLEEVLEEESSLSETEPESIEPGRNDTLPEEPLQPSVTLSEANPSTREDVSYQEDLSEHSHFFPSSPVLQEVDVQPGEDSLQPYHSIDLIPTTELASMSSVSETSPSENPVPQDSQATTTRITLPEEIVIATVQSLQTQLTDALGIGLPIVLEARAVERIDTAGLQLFAVFSQTAKVHGAKWQWEHPTTALIQSARILGATELLGLSA